jgi:hypothetical protein
MPIGLPGPEKWMSATVADFENLQTQLLHEKTENYSLQEQLEAAKSGAP